VIKQTLIADANSGSDSNVSKVEIIQMHQKDGFVLVEFEFNCCLEGGVALFKKDLQGYKMISSFGGYDQDDMTPIIRKYFYKKVPKSVKPMINCYQNK